MYVVAFRGFGFLLTSPFELLVAGLPIGHTFTCGRKRKRRDLHSIEVVWSFTLKDLQRAVGDDFPVSDIILPRSSNHGERDFFIDSNSIISITCCSSDDNFPAPSPIVITYGVTAVGVIIIRCWTIETLALDRAVACISPIVGVSGFTTPCAWRLRHDALVRIFIALQSFATKLFGTVAFILLKARRTRGIVFHLVELIVRRGADPRLVRRHCIVTAVALLAGRLARLPVALLARAGVVVVAVERGLLGATIGVSFAVPVVLRAARA